MNASIATLTLESLSPMSQSRQHEEPKLEGENHDAYDIRTWPHKMHVETRNNRSTVVIPSMAIHQALVAAAKYSKRQIPNQGKATWTAKFSAGIMILENPALHVDPEIVQCVAISANADGVRGSGKRVTRRFPTIPAWRSTFDVHILDPIITEDVFREMVEIAGLFVGIGQFRPQNLGSNGRFRITSLVWRDNRKLAA